jgi:hypothetical protein
MSDLEPIAMDRALAWGDIAPLRTKIIRLLEGDLCAQRLRSCHERNYVSRPLAVDSAVGHRRTMIWEGMTGG